jgi:hypothetical protein
MSSDKGTSMIRIEEREKRIGNRKDMLGSLFFTPYGRVTVFVVAAFILSCCVPSPASIPTASESVPTFTFTAEPPTSIPATATETAIPTPEIKEYPPNTSVEFEGTVTLSMESFIDVETALPGDATLLRWMLVTLDDGSVIAVNEVVQDKQEGSVFYTFSDGGSSGNPGYLLSDEQINMMNHLALDNNNLLDKIFKVTFTTGNDPSKYLTNPKTNPLDKTLNQELGNRMITFVQTQNKDVLPKLRSVTVKGEQVPLVIVYRMVIIEMLEELAK